ncbi:energy-converting hydrogenase B subunit D [Streptomyces canus]|uniref:hydrogenase subunit MbhD domain-containing protein n=1 Tax=Streptomyces canus TaxID=58343 RepID=UPI0027854FAC|nr:hydrogenase subunit MbhD domain-containing protein [Streptomyces canus]MDQ0597082.1 energy-converting hydrogenase B subunit D [Streptomyces canus]
MADAVIDAVPACGLLLVAATATTAVAVRDPVRQALVLSVLGVVLAVLFTVLQAPDVGLSQLAVGSALTPLLLLLAVHKVRRRARRKGRQE